MSDQNFDTSLKVQVVTEGADALTRLLEALKSLQAGVGELGAMWETSSRKIEKTQADLTKAQERAAAIRARQVLEETRNASSLAKIAAKSQADIATAEAEGQQKRLTQEAAFQNKLRLEQETHDNLMKEMRKRAREDDWVRRREGKRQEQIALASIEANGIQQRLTVQAAGQEKLAVANAKASADLIRSKERDQARVLEIEQRGQQRLLAIREKARLAPAAGGGGFGMFGGLVGAIGTSKVFEALSKTQDLDYAFQYLSGGDEDAAASLKNKYLSSLKSKGVNPYKYSTKASLMLNAAGESGEDPNQTISNLSSFLGLNKAIGVDQLHTNRMIQTISEFYSMGTIKKQQLTNLERGESPVLAQEIIKYLRDQNPEVFKSNDDVMNVLAGKKASNGQTYKVNVPAVMAGVAERMDVQTTDILAKQKQGGISYNLNEVIAELYDNVKKLGDGGVFKGLVEGLQELSKVLQDKNTQAQLKLFGNFLGDLISRMAHGLGPMAQFIAEHGTLFRYFAEGIIVAKLFGGAVSLLLSPFKLLTSTAGGLFKTLGELVPSFARFNTSVASTAAESGKAAVASGGLLNALGNWKSAVVGVAMLLETWGPRVIAIFSGVAVAAIGAALLIYQNWESIAGALRSTLGLPANKANLAENIAQNSSTANLSGLSDAALKRRLDLIKGNTGDLTSVKGTAALEEEIQRRRSLADAAAAKKSAGDTLTPGETKPEKTAKDNALENARRESAQESMRNAIAFEKAKRQELDRVAKESLQEEKISIQEYAARRRQYAREMFQLEIEELFESAQAAKKTFEQKARNLDADGRHKEALAMRFKADEAAKHLDETVNLKNQELQSVNAQLALEEGRLSREKIKKDEEANKKYASEMRGLNADLEKNRTGAAPVTYDDIDSKFSDLADAAKKRGDTGALSQIAQARAQERSHRDYEAAKEQMGADKEQAAIRMLQIQTQMNLGVTLQEEGENAILAIQKQSAEQEIAALEAALNVNTSYKDRLEIQKQILEQSKQLNQQNSEQKKTEGVFESSVTKNLVELLTRKESARNAFGGVANSLFGNLMDRNSGQLVKQGTAQLENWASSNANAGGISGFLAQGVKSLFGDKNATEVQQMSVKAQNVTLTGLNGAAGAAAAGPAGDLSGYISGASVNGLTGNGGALNTFNFNPVISGSADGLTSSQQISELMRMAGFASSLHA